MRASRRPGLARSGASTSAMAGATVRAGISRSFRWVPSQSDQRCSVREGGQVSGMGAFSGVSRAVKDLAGGHGDAGVHQKGGERRQLRRKGYLLTDAECPKRARQKAHRECRHPGRGAGGMIVSREECRGQRRASVAFRGVFERSEAPRRLPRRPIRRRCPKGGECLVMSGPHVCPTDDPRGTSGEVCSSARARHVLRGHRR